MQTDRSALRVLTACASPRAAAFFEKLVAAGHYLPLPGADSAAAARRCLLEQGADILIVNAPLPDEFGLQLALEAQRHCSCGVLLVVAGEQYEETCCRLEDTGVLCLGRPCAAQMAQQALRLLAASGRRVQLLQQRTISLHARMEEIRLVERAKWLLMSSEGLSEAEAHRAIEKRAMDRRTTRAEIARAIIDAHL